MINRARHAFVSSLRGFALFPVVGSVALAQVPAPAPESVEAAPALAPVDKAPASVDTAPASGHAPEYTIGMTEKRWRFGGSIGISGGDQMIFSKTKVSTTSFYTDSANVNYKTESALVGALEGIYMAPNAWGFNFGVSADTRRKLKSVEVSTSSGGLSGTFTGDGYVSVVSLYFNALYRWNYWYLPFGVIVSSVNVSGSTPPALNDLKGGGGLQFGMGYFFTENFALEGMYRGVALTSKSYTDVNGTVDLGNGTLGALVLNAKGYF